MYELNILQVNIKNMKKNVPFSDDILSLGWWFIDETYNPWIISELTTKAIKKKWYQILQYNDSLWLLELREHGRIFLQWKFWISNIGLDEIMVTNWATAWIDLVWRHILQWKYDSIALTPIYDTALESLKRNSRNVIPVELGIFEADESFILNWNKLEDIMKKSDVKLIYINTNFQNPTGIVFDEETKKKIYELSKANWVTVLEDDPYKLYNFDNHEIGENIVNMDEWKEQVIYLNSISKVFYPWLRIGFLVGNKTVIRDISELQKYSTSSPNLIMQWVSIEAFERWEIDLSISYYMREISEKFRIITLALQEKDLIWLDSPIEFSKSKGGFYLWWKFKKEINTDELSKKALQFWVSFVPWSIYGIDWQYDNSFRMAYAQIEKQRIEEAVSRFDNIVKDSI